MDNVLWFGFWLGMADAALIMIGAATVYLGAEWLSQIWIKLNHR